MNGREAQRIRETGENRLQEMEDGRARVLEALDKDKGLSRLIRERELTEEEAVAVLLVRRPRLKKSAASWHLWQRIRRGKK